MEETETSRERGESNQRDTKDFTKKTKTRGKRDHDTLSLGTRNKTGATRETLFNMLVAL